MKLRILLSTLVLSVFSILAGGSFSEDDFKVFFYIFIITIVIGGVFALIKSVIESGNKDKRLNMIKEDEQNSTDFDRSISIGDDRCKLYFDTNRKRIMIMRVRTEGITKKIIDNFEYSGAKLTNYKDGLFVVYDSINRKLLSGTYKDSEIIAEITDLAKKDKNQGITTKEPIEPFFSCIHVDDKNQLTSLVKRKYVLIDEYHGMVASVNYTGKLWFAFNYINSVYLPQKTGSVSKVSIKNIGNYMFIMDKFFKVLVLIGEDKYTAYNYSDIIEVSYEENGNQLFTKSTGRTVGGAIVGGMLMGGAGAVVGGLSGNTKQNKEVKSMDIKILVRSTEKSSFVLHFMDSLTPLNTKNENDKILYEKYLKNANEAKDLLSVIIDSSKQVAPIVSRPAISKEPSVADELIKLAKLKADGILTEEEFQAQKAKLLS